MTRGFLAAGALLVAALLVAAQISARRPAPAPAVKSAAPPIVLGDTTPPHRPASPKRVVERDLARLHPAPAGTARVARRFIVALLQYENDVNRGSALSVLKSTTTPRLWRMIAGGRRPVSRRGLSSGHLASVLKGRTSGSAASLVATVARRRGRSSLALVVVRRGSRWLVDALAR